MARPSTTRTIRIDGMTCVSCQRVIEKTLRRIDGVSTARVDWGEGTAEISYDPARVTVAALEEAIERSGYRISRTPGISRAGIGAVAAVIGSIVALYLLLEGTGVLNLLAPQTLADGSMGYGMLFAIGLATSVHCIAMCGGINLSQSLPSGACATPTSHPRSAAAFVPSALYNAGRVVSYTVIGSLLGALGMVLGGGGAVGLSPLVQGALKIVAGVVMVVMGVGMLGLFPGFRRLMPRLPRVLGDRIGDAASSVRRPFIVGLLNGLMPCGPLQSMQIVAFASGSPLVGALSMFAFSLGTVPLMLGLGSIVAALGSRFFRPVMTVGSMLVVVLGLAMVSQGGSLSGLIPPHLLTPLIIAVAVLGLASAVPARTSGRRLAIVGITVVLAVVAVTGWVSSTALRGSEGGRARIVDGVQVVSSTLEPGRYPNITVQAGVPVRWTIDAPDGSINGCNNRFLIPEYGIEHTFQPGENVVEFTPERPGIVSYACWMGMIKGTIDVVD